MFAPSPRWSLFDATSLMRPWQAETTWAHTAAVETAAATVATTAAAAAAVAVNCMHSRHLRKLLSNCSTNAQVVGVGKRVVAEGSDGRAGGDGGGRVVMGG